MLRAVQAAWLNPYLEVKLPSADDFAEAKKKKKKILFVKSVEGSKSPFDTADAKDAYERAQGLDMYANLRNTLMIVLISIRSSPRLDSEWKTALAQSGQWPVNFDVGALISRLHPLTKSGVRKKDRFTPARTLSEQPRLMQAVFDIVSKWQTTELRSPEQRFEMNADFTRIVDLAISCESNVRASQVRIAFRESRRPAASSAKRPAIMPKNLSLSHNPATGEEIFTVGELSAAKAAAASMPKVCKHSLCNDSCCLVKRTSTIAHGSERSQHCTSSAREVFLLKRNAREAELKERAALTTAAEARAVFQAAQGALASAGAGTSTTAFAAPVAAADDSATPIVPHGDTTTTAGDAVALGNKRSGDDADDANSARPTKRTRRSARRGIGCARS